jgi:nitrile hydratase beta subunit-like protein
MTFAPGDHVVVSSRPHSGHHRTPGYLKSRNGTVLRVHGRFRNPETRAYGGDGLPKERLYLVGFELSGGDRVFADIFEHWLERVA